LGSDVLHNAPSTGALDLAATQPWLQARSEAIINNRNSETAHNLDTSEWR
jgi:hypothetical protein